MCKKSKIFLTALSHRLHGTWLKHAILHVTIITKVLEFLFLTGDYITRSYFWVIPSFQPYIDIIAVGKYKPSSNLHLYDSFNARYNAQSPTIKEKISAFEDQPQRFLLKLSNHASRSSQKIYKIYLHTCVNCRHFRLVYLKNCTGCRAARSNNFN